MYVAAIRLYFIFASAELILGDLKMLLLHTNDMHARLKEVSRTVGRCDDSSKSCYGGFARVRYVAEQKKKEAEAAGRSVIFLNAGDNFQGTPYYNMFKWRIMVPAVNALEFDVISLGNHEFDDGIEGLTPFIEQVNAPVVCSNLDWSEEPALVSSKLAPFKILTVKGIQIGVIGYLTPDMSRRGTGRIKIHEEIPSIRAVAQKLLKENVKILIALGHSGTEREIRIAKEVAEIDLVVGAHSHTFLYTGTQPDIETPSGPYPIVVTQDSGKKVPVVQAFHATKYLGYLELDFDNEGNLMSWHGSPILLTGNYPQDQGLVNFLTSYDKKVAEMTARIIGSTEVFLDNDDWKCRLVECNIGNMITDAFVYYVTTYCQPADETMPTVAMYNSGGIRTSLDVISGGGKGSITLEDVMTVLPFENHLAVLEVTGQMLVEILEISVARFGKIKPAEIKEFMQVSGLRVTYQVKSAVGSRVDDVLVRCPNCKTTTYEPLVRDKIYRLVLPEYFTTGHRMYPMLTKFKDTCDLSEVDYAMVAKYIETHSPISPRIENRIVIERHGYLRRLLNQVARFVVRQYDYLRGITNKLIKNGSRIYK